MVSASSRFRSLMFVTEARMRARRVFLQCGVNAHDVGCLRKGRCDTLCELLAAGDEPALAGDELAALLAVERAFAAE